MARPQKVTDEEILAAARAAFIEHGPACPTSTIAAVLGVSQPALFKRFGTKQALMTAALAPPEIPPFVALVEDGPDDRPLPEQLEEIGVQIASYFLALVPCMSVLRASGITPEQLIESMDEPPPVRAKRAIEGWFRRGMASGRVRPDVDPGALAMAFLGSIHLRVFLGHIVPGLLSMEDGQVDVASAVDVLWRGAAPRREAGE